MDQALRGIVTMNSAELEKLGLEVIDEVINKEEEFSACPKCGTQMIGGCGQKTGHILLRLFHAKSVLNRTQST